MSNHSERFASRGIRTGVPADALIAGEYPYLLNVRGNTLTELTTRAGTSEKFAVDSGAVANISTYTGGTSPSPRILAVANGKVYLDTGTAVDAGYLPTPSIPSMLPFRPNQSPQPWMYIGDSKQYRKVSAPGVADAVVAQAVGIVEPQAPPVTWATDVSLAVTGGLGFVDPAQLWHNSGAVGGVTIRNGPALWRSQDTIVAVFADPASGAGIYTLQVTGTVQYQREQLVVTDTTTYARVQDVFQPIPAGITISAMQYLSGATGLCIIVPKVQAPGPGSGEQSIFELQVLANLRRGALVQIGTGGTAEVCYVYDVETGPNGTICFTTSTVGAHTAAETLSGVPAIQAFLSAPTPGHALNSSDITFNTSNGIGQIDFYPWAPTNFFTFGGASFQPDDYVSFSVNIDDLTQLVEMKLVIDVSGAPVPNFTDNYYFYAIRPSDIAAGTQNKLTQLGVAQLYTQRQQIADESAAGVAASKQTVPGDSQWSVISIPLRAFIRVGNDQTKTLNDATGMQFLFNTAGGGMHVAISSITIHGGGQMDVGMAGRPYVYRIRPRSSLTGARGNPSPPVRYGTSPRRQITNVALPTTYPDAQMDLWDIFRLGGALDSYRLVGTVPLGTTPFVDDYSDQAIAAAEVLEFDNLQPWPTLDYPLAVPTGVTVTGTIVTFTLAGGDAHLLTIPRYLPGNQVRINQTVYTLYTRPTIVGTTVTMLLVENADAVTGGALYIYEPQMANQPLPFLWGPTAEGGTVFGCGDPFRPGTVSFSKNQNPDSVPDRYNLELCPPSEPLTGGILRNGESFCCSNVHWWALRPSFGSENQWTPRLLPLHVGAVSHFAICPDAFVAKDGIYDFAGKSLTTRDNIYSLFPHEGVAGSPHTYAGLTVYPPDYTKVAQFRLASANGFLYFDYPDTNGGFSHLTYDIRAGAWYPDATASANWTLHYGVPQKDPQATTLVLVGDLASTVSAETFGVGDNGLAIAAVVATREFCPGNWAYAWFENPGLDLLPTAQVTASVTSLGALVGTPATFHSQPRITQGIVDVGGGQPLKSQGLLLQWSQGYLLDAPAETAPVVLYMAQWIAVPYPEPILSQRTKGTSHGLRGFQHLYLGQLAYVAPSAPVTITLEFDQPGGAGASMTITLPATAATGPDPIKQQWKFPPNKWKIASYAIASPQPFFLWPKDCEMWVGPWGRDGAYHVIRPWGGEGSGEPYA